MPLRNVRIAPGFNKADTPSGAEGQWYNQVDTGSQREEQAAHRTAVW